MHSELINALEKTRPFPHPVQTFTVIQTHLSWVILTGPFAYKIKKPVNLGFQDFTSLEKRKHFCELEIELNKRLAPQLYIDVIPITGTLSHPEMAGNGPVLEYAVKMHQFPQEALLLALVKQGTLKTHIIEHLAKQIVQFHQSAPQCPPTSLYGDPEEVFAPIQENFRALEKLPAAAPFQGQIAPIAKWAQEQYEILKPLLISRKSQGCIRACHGDLHLGNIVMFADQPLIFDCIEFNENFRWTDIMNDVSFLAMDLEHQQLYGLSHLFINKYFESSGDYTGAKLLKFYQCYRAMVRAKVCALQIPQLASTDPLLPQLQAELTSLLALALTYTQSIRPTLTLTVGVSGSGKTLYSEHLLMRTGAIRLRSDVIRKQTHGLAPEQPLSADQKKQLYKPQVTQAIYAQLRQQAKELLQAELSVIIDATCLKTWQRQLFFQLANELQVPLELLVFSAPEGVLIQRLIHRSGKVQASDADVDVMRNQLAAFKPLSAEEEKRATYIPSNVIDELIQFRQTQDFV